MDRKYLLYFLAVILYFHAFPVLATNNNGYPQLTKPLDSNEVTEVVKTIKSLQENIEVITAHVYQKKKTTLLKKEVETEGTITLKKPNLLYWDVTKPERLITIVDGKIMWVYNPDLKEVQRFILADQFMARQAMYFFSSAMSISVDETGKRFDITVYNPDNNFVFEMKPKSSMVARYLAVMYIWYKKGEGVPFKFEVIGKKGNITITEFKDIVVNPPIKENIFHFDVPVDVRITNLENGEQNY